VEVNDSGDEVIEPEEPTPKPPAKKRRVTWAVEAEMVRIHEVETIAAIQTRMPEDADEEPEKPEAQVTETQHAEEDEEEEAFFNLTMGLASASNLKEGEALKFKFRNVKVDSARETILSPTSHAAKKSNTEINAAPETSPKQRPQMAPSVGPPTSPQQGAGKAEGDQQPEEVMEWFCDGCEDSIPDERWECTVCPDEFCLCGKCKASIGHPHPLLASRSNVHITKLLS